MHKLLPTLKNIKNLKTSFIIRPLLEKERGQAIQFAENREVECTSLMEQLLRSTENVFVLENIQNKNFCALFSLKNISTILHLIEFSQIQNNIEEVKKTIWNFLQDKKIFCIYGEQKGSQFLSQILLAKGRKLILSNEYYLMQNDFSSKIIKGEFFLTESIFIKKCTIDDVCYLVELEKGYRKEEVIITQKEEDEKIIRFVLNNSLQNQNVFAAFFLQDGKNVAVAKAATNACGKNYFQIGGVYCKQEFRNKKITFFTMIQLLEFIQSKNKKANLFVKVKNLPAQKVYKNLNFKECGKYMINYFQK